MRRTLVNILFVVLAGLLFSGCYGDPFGLKKEKKWSVTLKNDSKNPYGTFLAYNSVRYYFPDAKIETISRYFRYTHMDNNMKYNNTGTSLLVLIGLDFYISDQEWEIRTGILSS